MGLSSKQVIINRDSGGLDWSQHQTLLPPVAAKPPPTSTMRRQQQLQQPPPEPLKCPRCDSTNTKFCYYNNYNKSQPRHFCRACKRHWTKGGTLRNVPVGGGRKNKRPKKSNAAAATTGITTSTTTTTTETNTLNSHVTSFQAYHHRGDHHHIYHDHDKTISEILHQAVLIGPPPLPPSSLPFLQPSLMISSELDDKSQGLHQFPAAAAFSSSSSSPFDQSNLCSFSSSYRTSEVVCYGEDHDQQLRSMVAGEPTVTSGGAATQLPWEASNSIGIGMEADNNVVMPNYWNWEDIDTLVSTDINQLPWDDSNDQIIKP